MSATTETKVIQRLKNESVSQEDNQREEDEKPPITIPLLDTLKWVAASKAGEKSTSTYASLRRNNWLYIIMAPIELILLSVILFVTQLPWPEWMLNLIYKVDAVLVKILDDLLFIVVRMWNLFTVTLMRIRQGIEDILDFFLSLAVFAFVKVSELYAKVFKFVVNVMRVVFYPWIRTAEYFISLWKTADNLSCTNAPNQGSTANQEELENKSVSSNDSNFNGKTNYVAPTLRTPPSDYESDHSIVSENSMTAHDKLGKMYKKVDYVIAPQGRLREELLKHVHTQLKVMRKNSVRISRDVASYAKTVLEPKLSPLREWLYHMAEEMHLVTLYKRIEMEVLSRPYLAKPIEKVSAFFLAFFTTLSQFIQGAKRSKRSRSVRTESQLRRAAAEKAMVSTESPTLGPSALRQSAEPTPKTTPIIMDTKPSTPSPLIIETPPKTNIDNDEESNEGNNRDSALASSIDDLYMGSDDAPPFVPQSILGEKYTDRKQGTWSKKDDVINKKEKETKVKKNVRYRI